MKARTGILASGFVVGSCDALSVFLIVRKGSATCEYQHEDQAEDDSGDGKEAGYRPAVKRIVHVIGDKPDDE